MGMGVDLCALSESLLCVFALYASCLFVCAHCVLVCATAVRLSAAVRLEDVSSWPCPLLITVT